MSAGDPRRRGDELLLAVAATVATLLTIPLVLLAGTFEFWMIAAVVAAAAMVYARRDSSHGLAALGVVVLVWVAARPDALSPWTVALALLMFTTHAALALQTTAPPGADLGRAVRERWLRRCALVAALTGLVYLVALALRDLHRSGAEVTPGGRACAAGWPHPGPPAGRHSAARDAESRRHRLAS